MGVSESMSNIKHGGKDHGLENKSYIIGDGFSPALLSSDSIKLSV